MAEHLAERLGSDQGKASQSQVEKEGREQRTRRADRDVEEPRHPAQYEEAAVRIRSLGVAPEEEPAGPPGGDEHEGADDTLGDGWRQ